MRKANSQRPKANLQIDLIINQKYRAMKKNQMLLTAVLFCLAMAASLGATAQNKVLPKQEFTINGFGGLSTLKYSIDGVDVNKGFAGGGGLGYNIFFSDHWGLTTGIEAAMYKATAKADKMTSGQIVSYYDEDYLSAFTIGKFKETHHTWMVQIPLMLNWLAPLNAAKTTHFYISAGGRLGYAFEGKYKQTGESLSYVSTQMSENGMYQSDPKSIGAYSDSHCMKFAKWNGILSAEIGLRWKLGRSTALYTGIYGDYGLTDIAPDASNNALMTISATDHPQEVQGIGRSYSILQAHKPDYALERETKLASNSERYVGKIHPFAAGIKIRLAFGKTKKIIPAPVPIIQHDTIIKEVPVVVHDTVEVVKEVPQEIKESMMKLSNTLFAFDKFNLSDEAVTELDKVTAWLKDNPNINVEIDGHTDSYGSDAYNQKLSENRAKSVYDYFANHGVDAQRLSYKGYGESQPIADNATAAGRKQNRRVELKIVK
jgi:outer membrane protein OmpA-like peptidoglycan-associated protein/opacity protein-like surface antigen